jgi:CDP-diglyceride synthetase
MSETPKPSRLETILAYAAVGVVGVSLVSMFVALMMQFFQFSPRPAILFQLPLIGLPVGFLLILSLLVASIIRRSRENRGL